VSDAAGWQCSGKFVSSSQAADISFKFRGNYAGLRGKNLFCNFSASATFVQRPFSRLKKSALMAQANQAIEWLSPGVANLVD
jgi:hypothetical protein